MEDALGGAISFALKNGASQVEAFGSVTRTAHVTFEKKQVKTAESKIDRGIGIRALLTNGGSSLGSSFSMSTSREALEKAAKDSVSVAKTRKPESFDVSFETGTSKRPARPGLVDKKLRKAGLGLAANLSSRMIKAASMDRRVRSISGHVTLTHCEIFFQNSLGVEGHYEGTVFSASVWVTAKQGGSIGSAFDGYAGRFYNAGPPVKMAARTAETAIAQLRPRKVNPGRTVVVLGPEALEGLTANILTPSLRADLVQKNQSPLAGKMGQKIADESVTIIDDGTVPGYVGSKSFDDEGHPVGKRTVVEKGKLVTYFHNHKSTASEGKDKAGNGVRIATPEMTRKYAGDPQILPHNLLVKPGRYALDDLISEVKDGIYTRSLIGAHTANRVTGEFSVVPQMAYKITDGEIEHPLKDTVLSGNMMDLLRNAKMVGRDPIHLPSISGDSSLTTPPLLVEGLSISG